MPTHSQDSDQTMRADDPDMTKLREDQAGDGDGEPAGDSTTGEDRAPSASPHSEPLVFTVPHALDGFRLDMFLSRSYTQRSRAFFQRCIKDGLALLNGEACRQRDLVRTNDTVIVQWPERPEIDIQPEQIDFEVVKEDDDVLVINKPSGLVVHPAKGNWTGTLVQALLHYDAEHFGQLLDENLRPGIVHRLDKDTSGVMVVAKNEGARLALKRAFAERRVEKTYLTLVLGEFGVVTGRMENLIGRNPRHPTKMAVLPNRGKRAATRYRVLDTAQGISLVEVNIETGRTHQIRVHFSHILHPVLGDSLYGGCRRDVAIMPARQMLHAWKLMFPHPKTNVSRQYMASPPQDFQNTLAALGMRPIGLAPKGENPHIDPDYRIE